MRDERAFNWLNQSQLGYDIWEKKYRANNESFDSWLDRVSGGDAAVRKLIEEKKFLFGGRILAQRGINSGKTTYSNCYVLPAPEDNIESIWDCAKEMARTYSCGGGCGTDLGKLAPKGATVNNAAKTTSGATSFMDLFSTTTGLIGQCGRRGALMLTLPVNHPDIEEFIDIKKDLNRVTKANISVRFNDKFFEAAKANEDFIASFTREATGEKIEKKINAKKLLEHFAHNAWEMAEPGALFWDRVTGYNLCSDIPEYKLESTNPCVTGDTLVYTVDDGEIAIKDLVGTQPQIMCMDETGELAIKRASKVWKTRENAELLQIKFNGGSLRCTPEHLICVKGKGWVEAKNLVKGDELASYDMVEKKRVQKIVRLSYTEDVYDLTVPETHNFIANGIVIHNCGEEPLPPGGACLLGSLNLSEFVGEDKFVKVEELKSAVRIAVRGLNTVLEEGTERHPLPIQREMARDWKQIGLGIFGLADMLIKMGLRYDSDEAIELCSCLSAIIAETAIMESNALAKELGAFPKCNNEAICNSEFVKTLDLSPVKRESIFTYGLRNSAVLTIAPTGSLSTMLGVSGGIEPIFSNSYTRKTESLNGKDTYYKVYTPIVGKYMKEHDISDEVDLPDYFVTAHDIDPLRRVKMQATWQEHIDASISSTVNLRNEVTPEEVYDVYMEAWKLGCKGVTVYRDGCARTGILTTGKEKQEEKESALQRGDIIKCSDDMVGKKRKLVTGCGSLHCEAFFDPESGDLMETFFSKGSTGGCNSFMVGLSRMISLAARSGCDFNSIIDQLNSCITCPSYAVRKAVQKDVSPGNCCPAAIGKALKEMHDEMMDEIGEPSETVKIVSKAAESPRKAEVIVPQESKCPECGGALDRTGGCVTCHNCGWSRCG